MDQVQMDLKLLNEKIVESVKRQSIIRRTITIDIDNNTFIQHYRAGLLKKNIDKSYTEVVNIFLREYISNYKQQLVGDVA